MRQQPLDHVKVAAFCRGKHQTGRQSLWMARVDTLHDVYGEQPASSHQMAARTRVPYSCSQRYGPLANVAASAGDLDNGSKLKTAQKVFNLRTIRDAVQAGHWGIVAFLVIHRSDGLTVCDPDSGDSNCLQMAPLPSHGRLHQSSDGFCCQTW